MIERALIAAVALAVAVLGLIWLHSSQLQADAQKIAKRPPQQLSKAEIDHAVHLFERARADNPDTQPLVLEAGLLIRVKRTRQGLALARTVTRREPDNLTAWVLVTDAAGTIDPALARTAYKRAIALNPLAARAR